MSREPSKKVTGIIDDIVFQTNLLSLNGTVTAIRAGGQGRVAVITSEIRRLAQRSTAAAKEIKALINDSAEKVKRI